MRNGVKGIFYNKQSGKFDVRINRQGITYNIGKYKELEDAIQALSAFLADYELNPPEPVIEKYSKKWWQEEAKKQKDKWKY